MGPKKEGTTRPSFGEEYGKFLKVLYYGASSTVQLYEKKAPMIQPASPSSASPSSPVMARLRRASTSKTIRELYAVKVFRHPKFNSPQIPTYPEDEKPPALLCHPNIVAITDILYNKQADLCLVMPYCSGGNLHSFLSYGGKLRDDLSIEEVNCLIIQILRAVAFLHENNIAHGDIRPARILLTARGAVKLGGFGEDEDAVRALAQLSHNGSSSSGLPAKTRVGSVSSINSSSGLTMCIRQKITDSSIPWLPPERFANRRGSQTENFICKDVLNIKAADVWSCGIIYLALRFGQLPWKSAQKLDASTSFADYLRCRCEEDGWGRIQALESRCRNVVYAMLHPDPGLRITAEEILQSEWALGVAICEVGERGL
ncbi:kinase-like domain-containing protein [Penicillium macrosclerotiorum]|uniref:kinase-like domain-containing protein n=1 Tax=Penicillium macrosclerotiorum TaxID=303699 RepID=UPI00254742FD|nr:kinase-like domain-containing protein [Penicillium macrosclerotiorum]KAJ5675414.1 kinase-like domain-containing protein [Penicillium macrosclerotiorum]